MHNRRGFLIGMTALAVTGGVVAPAASAVPTPLPPPSIAARNARRAPTAWGMAMPGIVSSFTPAGRQVALTFDACQGGCDDALIGALVANAIPAVLFLNAKWIDANPGRAATLAANPLFEIGNHGTRHVPLSVTGRSAYGIRGTRSAAEVVDEVWTNHNRITALTGRPPSWFRTGTAHYDDVAVDIVRELGETPLGFSVNADNGATASAGLVRANLLGAKPGSIVLAHMNRPRSGTAAGFVRAIPALRTAGWSFVRVSDPTAL